MGMRCSIVIPCYNGAELTRACIASLLEQDLPPTEILIVDNGSSDETAQLGELDATVRVIGLASNRGFAGGVNAGLREAIGDTALILNNDTQASPNLLRELHQVLCSDSNIGACAPLSNHVKGEAHLAIGQFGKQPEQRVELTAELQNSATALQDTDTLAGLCLLLRKSTLHEIGWFDERFGHGNFEDDDFCLRLRLRGYRLVIAQRAFLFHEGHATFHSMGLNLKEEMARRLTQFHDKWQRHPAGLATLAAMQCNYRLAAEAAQQARRIAPAWLDADWHIGRHLESHGEPQRAMQHLRAYLDLCPEHVEAQLTLALAMMATGMHEAAKRQLHRTLQRHRPTPKQEAHVSQRLGQLAYEAGHYQQAAEHLRTAIALKPDSGELYNWLGLCELGDQQLTAAATSFQKSCELGYSLAHTNLGICHARLGQINDAMLCFAEAVALLPNNPVARANYEAGVAACSATC